jgi:proline iminopeptidase
MASFVPAPERDDLAAAYHARVLHDDPAVHVPAAIALMIYEAQTLHLWPNRALIDTMRTDPATVASGRIFCHYDRNAFFLADRQLLHGAVRLAGIPAAILGGRYDMCTPIRFAWELHRAWPGSTLEIVPAAGHTWGDPLLAAAIARTTDAWRQRILAGDPAFGAS